MTPVSQADRIESKLDSLHNKVDNISTTQARHDERIKTLENGQSSQGSKLWAVLAMVLSGVVGAVTSRIGK